MVDICKPTDEIINGMAIASDTGYCIPPIERERIMNELKNPLVKCPQCGKDEPRMRALGLKQIPHYWCSDCNSVFMIRDDKIRLGYKRSGEEIWI
jgi:hypothetical protein